MNDKVVHKPISVKVDSSAKHFPAEMSLAFSNIIDKAHELGSTIDWSTLEIEAPEVFTVRDYSGLRETFSDGMMHLHVDSIIIEEDE